MKRSTSKAKPSSSTRNYEIWICVGDESQCIYTTTIPREAGDCFNGFSRWRETTFDEYLEFAIIVDGKPVTAPGHVHSNSEWDEFWKELQSEKVTFFDVFGLNADDSGEVNSRHFDLSDAVLSVLRVVNHGGRYRIRKQMATLTKPSRKAVRS